MFEIFHLKVGRKKPLLSKRQKISVCICIYIVCVYMLIDIVMPGAKDNMQ